MANVIEKAREVAGDLYKKGEVKVRRGKVKFGKAVDNYIESLQSFAKNEEKKAAKSSAKPRSFRNGVHPSNSEKVEKGGKL